eukprot:gene4247-8443_t
MSDFSGTPPSDHLPSFANFSLRLKQGQMRNSNNGLSPTKDLISISQQTSTFNRGRKSLSNFTMTLCTLPEVCLHRVISFFVAESSIDIESFYVIESLNKYISVIANSAAVWYNIGIIRRDGKLSIDSLKLIKKKSQGTEGTCYQVYSRSQRRDYALKRARVYPDNEGVPYYMMRELSALKKVSHPNICELQLIHLRDFKLYLLFPYIEHTLHDFLNPSGEPNSGRALRKTHVHNIMKQLLDAVSHIHRRGIMHRNLKPKHVLLIPGPENAQVKLADFALVRILGHPSKKFTTEVITLWYRPPEILMGQKEYSASVDMWSLGCIFAEMLQGRPLFTGLCEIDQLFQIFFKMGTPTPNTWQGFTAMPHYQDSIFPIWHASQLRGQVGNANEIEFDFLSRCLRFEPMNRISAQEAIKHPYVAPSTADLKWKDSDSSTVTGMVTVPCSSRDDAAIELVSIGEQQSASSSVSSSDSDYHRSLDSLLDDLEIKQKYFHNDLVILHKTTMRQYYFLRQLESTTSPLHSHEDGGCRKRLGLRGPDRSSSPSVDSPQISSEGDEAKHAARAAGRAELVDWLIEVLDVFDYHMCLRTAYFAVALVDRFLISNDSLFAASGDEDAFQTVEDRLRLLGATCLHIASKCEDVSYIGIKDLASQTSQHNAYEPREILVMEEIVLNTLGFDVYLPTGPSHPMHCIAVLSSHDSLSHSSRGLIFLSPIFTCYGLLIAAIDFIGFYTECVPELIDVRSMQCCARYIGEISLLQMDVSREFSPSLVAAASVFLSLHLSDKPPWSPILSVVTGYKPPDFEHCLRALHKAHKDMSSSPGLVVYQRYLRSSNCEVAQWTSKALPSSSQLKCF